MTTYVKLRMICNKCKKVFSFELHPAVSNTGIVEEIQCECGALLNRQFKEEYAKWRSFSANYEKLVEGLNEEQEDLLNAIYDEYRRVRMD